MKDLQSWRTSDGMGFASCVERVMAAIDTDLRLDLGVTLEGIDEILDRIAATSSFSSIDLEVGSVWGEQWMLWNVCGFGCGEE
jgi:DNA ligase 4